MTSEPEFMTAAQLCATLDIDRVTLYRWRRRGIAPVATVVGRQKLLFRRADVDKWLETRRDRAAS